MVQKKLPRDEAESFAYKYPDGSGFYIPGAAFSRLLRESGGNHKLRGSRKSAKYVVPAAVLVTEESIRLLNGDGKSPAKDFEVDSRPVTIPATKGCIMRHRPRFDHWSATFFLRINETILDPAFVQQLLTEGGQQIGIGDFRPEKGGTIRHVQRDALDREIVFWAMPGNAWHGKARRGEARSNFPWQGTERLCVSGLGQGRRGAAGWGNPRHGAAGVEFW